jgi:stage III sporulation protein SpoIIIAA
MEMGVRVMRPDVIITDEVSVKELSAIYRAIHSGVKIIASFHAKEVSEIPLEIRNTFDKIVVLDEKIIGKIKEII